MYFPGVIHEHLFKLMATIAKACYLGNNHRWEKKKLVAFIANVFILVVAQCFNFKEISRLELFLCSGSVDDRFSTREKDNENIREKRLTVKLMTFGSKWPNNNSSKCHKICSTLTTKSQIFFSSTSPADIYEEVSSALQPLGLDTECLGGGRIAHNPNAKPQIKVYGYSQVTREKDFMVGNVFS